MGGSRKRRGGGDGGAMGAVLGVCSLASWVSAGLPSHPRPAPSHPEPSFPSRGAGLARNGASAGGPGRTRDG